MIPVVMPTYTRADIVFERGEGAYLFDIHGRRYLDFASGMAVTGLGHCPPRLVEAITKQAGLLWHTSNLYRVAGQERVASRLVANTFADTVFFTNSGVEAWECAIKLMRKHYSHSGEPQRWRIITFDDCFHGRTLAAIAASGKGKMVAGFGPVSPGFDRVPFGDIEAVKAAITEETAGIMIEPIQGEGGIVAAIPEFLQQLRALATQKGLLLAVDEIQCGMGRSGHLFAHEASNIIPDVMCIAKGIGGGFPVGACLATEAAADGMVSGTHGSTFGGNPLAMAVADAVLDEMLAPEFLPDVRAVAEKLQERLRDLVREFPQVFTDVRGVGLMLGLGCVVNNMEVVRRLRAAGLLTAQASNNVVRLLPPLIIDDGHITEVIDILRTVTASFTLEPPVAAAGASA